MWDETQEKTRLRPHLVAQAALTAARRLSENARVLDSLNPLAILARGYAVVTRADGSLVKSAADARRETALGLRFADDPAPVAVSVGGAPVRPRGKATGEGGPVQATLF